MKAALYSLGTPEQAILRAIHRYHYLTARQLARLLYRPTSLNYVQEHLKLLTEAKFLVTRHLPRRQPKGSTPYVYALGNKGAKALEQMGIELPRAVKPSSIPTGELFLEHTLAVADTLIAIERLSYVEPRIHVAGIQHERELKAAPLPITLPGFGKSKVAPDGFVEVHIDGQWREGIWLEVDRGTEEQPAWRRKVRAILAASRGPYQEYFGINSLTVAVVAMTGPVRRDTLRRWSEAEVGDSPEDADLFRFASGAAIEDAENLFLGPNWFRPGGSEPIPLFTLDDGG